jgi:hypothetical protein
VGLSARVEEDVRNASKTLIGIPEGVRSLKRLGHSLKIHLKGMGREDVDWIHLTQDRKHWRSVVNTVKNL